MRRPRRSHREFYNTRDGISIKFAFASLNSPPMRYEIRRNLFLGIGAAVVLVLVWALAGWFVGGWAGAVVWSLSAAPDSEAYRSTGQFAGLLIGASFAVLLALSGYFVRLTRPNDAPVKEPELKRRLDSAASALAIAAGIPVPTLDVVVGGSTAEVAGRHTTQARITVGADLVRAMQHDEMMALLAHEFSHLKNGDVVSSSLNQTLESWTQRLLAAGVVIYVAGFAALSIWGRDLRAGFTIGLVLDSAWIFLVIVAIGRGATWVAAAMLNSSRELMADATAIDLTRDPSALLRALSICTHASERAKGSACINVWPGRLEAIKRIAAVVHT